VEAIIARWGYLAVLLGCLLEGETIVVVGGIMAHKGLLRLEGVMLSAFVGSLLGDQGWFLLGRHAGLRWFSRWRRFQKVAQRIARWTKGPSAWFVLGFRFAYGIRTVAPFLLGGSRYPVRKFVLLNGLGAALWSLAIPLRGWFLGVTIERALGRTAHIEEIVWVGAGVILLSLWVHRRRSRR
jgi:membrane protein DedA with SNARE-associated domain